MKTRNQTDRYIIAFFSVVCLSTSSALAQLSCEAQISKTEILPFEPLELLLSVRNTGPETVITNLNWGTWILVGKPKMNGAGWQWSSPYVTRAAGNSPPPLPMPPRAETFRPNEVRFTQVVSVLNTISGFGDQYKRLFETPGQLGVIGDIRGIRSEPVVITILTPAGPNAEAMKALRSMGIAEFFSEYTFTAMQVTKGKMSVLQEFAKRYKDSAYADYATLGLALVHLKGMEEIGRGGKIMYQPELSVAENYFTALSKKQGSLVQDRATYYLAVCRSIKGEKQSAAEILQRVSNRTADPILRFKASRLMR